MEKRQHERTAVNFPVEYRILGSDARSYRGQLRDISEGGVRISVAEPVDAGAFLKVKVGDCTIFGQVSYCCPFLAGHLCGLLVERVLLGNSDLGRLMSALLETQPQPEPATEPKDV